MASKPLWLERQMMVIPLHLALCTTEQAFKKALKQLNVPKEDCDLLEFPHLGGARTTLFYNHDTAGNAAFVLMKKPYRGINKNQVHAILVHEAIHVWQRVKEIIKEPNPSSEFEAYSLENITKTLFDAYDKA